MDFRLYEDDDKVGLKKPWTGGIRTMTLAPGNPAPASKDAPGHRERMAAHQARIESYCRRRLDQRWAVVRRSMSWASSGLVGSLDALVDLVNRGGGQATDCEFRGVAADFGLSFRDFKSFAAVLGISLKDRSSKNPTWVFELP